LKIRPEEFINYFDYNYRSPHNSTFAVYPEAAASPFRPENTLFRIGIQGKRLGPDTQTKNNYIILLDASGSMAVKDRMELARKALKMLFSKLKDTDLVSLMLCGEKTTMVAKHRPLFKSNREWLLRTMDQIAPHGVADFAEGISQAYTFADKYYIPNNSNRIIIISDGIFEIKNGKRPMIFSKIEDARKRGISNIVIGLGGDGDDETLEKVASTGDGSYVFLDTEREAKELFNSQFEARFREIARDVKIQVQFNKDAVKSYRQIGYKNRQLSAADFRNDKVDAGEVGSGQSVTALYELKLNENITKDTIVATIRIRYKKAEDMSIEEKVFYLFGNDIKENFANASANFKLAALVAEFSEALRYPETQDIASTRGIADKLNALKMKDFSKSMKVSELLTLIKKSK
jgi:Ca-activated chloride channel family protein